MTSVIIVNFNAGPLLIKCVMAALGSTAKVQVLVVDNGSTDSSIEGLRQAVGSEDRLLVIENGANLGFAAACNIGIRKSHGEYMLLLNPDCVIEPDTLEKMLAVMESSPEVGMAGPLIRNEDRSEQVGCRRDIPTLKTAFVRAFGLGKVFGVKDFNQAGQPLPENPSPVEAISGAFMLARRSAVEKVGLMDEGYFLHCEDLDWCLRFTRAGYKILFVSTVEVVHHKGASSAAIPVRVELYKSRGMARFYRKFNGQGPVYWFVVAGIWLRFGIFAGISYLRSATKG